MMPVDEDVLKATFSGVSDSLSVPHFLLALDGTIVLANKAAKAKFSAQNIQIEGLNIQDIVSDSPERLKGILRIWSGNQSPMLSKLSFKMKGRSDTPFLCKGCTMRILNHKTSAFLLLQCQEKNKSISVFLALNKRIEQLEHEKSLQFNEKEKVERLNKKLELRVKERTEELEKAYSNLSKSLDEFKQAQEQLVHTERLASLGRLVANVAHEISTPIGVCVTAASHLEQHVETFKQHYSQGKLTRTDFESYLNTSSESSSIITYNLLRAADLIHSFKQLAVDQTSNQLRKINMKRFIDELLVSLLPYFKHTPHQYEFNCADDIELSTYPGAIAQVFTNLISNSFIHGFEGIEQGQIIVDISRDEERILLRYTDNGIGLSDEVKAKIFEPFFTTKRNKGGSGLGMSIVYNLVKNKLQGDIKLSNDKTSGVNIDIFLPITLNRVKN